MATVPQLDERRGAVARPASLEVFLLGQIDLRACLALQQRLIDRLQSSAGGQMTLLICEHPAVISIGRGGSVDDIQVRGAQLAGRSLDVFRVPRGGGAMLHLPGQLAVYPIVPLDERGWTVGELLDRFQNGLLAALAELGIAGYTRPGRHGVWGASGQLVGMGMAVKHWISHFGAHINVAPTLHLAKYLVTDPVDKTPAGSLSAECGSAVRMPRVRARVIRAVADSFGCERYHPYTGHPLLAEIVRNQRVSARAS
jgi:lipoate-protein ligase B